MLSCCVMAMPFPSQPLRARLALAGVAALSLTLASCCRKVGSHTETYSFGKEKCPAKDQSCIDPTTANLCLGDNLTTLKCRGLGGCSVSGSEPKSVWCDQSLAREGDLCLPKKRGPNQTCSENERVKLECNGDKWVKLADCAKCYHKSVAQDFPHRPIESVECE